MGVRCNLQVRAGTPLSKRACAIFYLSPIEAYNKRVEVSLSTTNPLTNLSDSTLIRSIENSRGPIVITSCELEDNPIIYCNQAFIDLTGYDYDEIIGKNCRFLQGPETDREEVKKIREAVTHKDHGRAIFRNYRKDGSLFWNDLVITPIEGESGNIEYFVGMQLDITDRLAAEEKLIENDRRQRQLSSDNRALQKLNKTKDEFISIASHQLRSPATAVKQYIGMILEGYVGELTPAQTALLRRAYDSNERQLGTLNELLRTAKLDTPSFRITKQTEHIDKIISECINDLKPIIELKAQSLEYETFNDKSSVKLQAPVDKNELKTVIEMLIENASKYSNNGTAIKVSTYTKDGNVCIIVKDQGVGISKADRDRIFEKFTRVNNELSTTINGTGLGLYWVKRIIELHGGSIKVNSTLGKGSEFIISLPL